jgi:FliI/YscN family ATPase
LLETCRQVLRGVQPVGLTGRVSGVRGLTVSVADLPAPIGAACRIGSAAGGIDGRVIAFADEQTLVLPMGSVTGIRKGDAVCLLSARQVIGAGADMLGRVLDAAGRPIDGGPPLRAEARVPLWPEPVEPMRRRPIRRPLVTGVRAIDGLLTTGRGQRMGVFSASGVGKSVLLGMIARHATADAVVIGLIGERSREVRDFLENDLGPEGLARSVVVVSTSNEPPPARVEAAAVATAVAEHFRDRGGDVLLLMDSLTRLAGAQRQIGLAAGEPPTTSGYTPSVFSLLPELLERSGTTDRGTLTGFYSVLADDAGGGPIAEAVRAVTDGHIHLSSELAKARQYPAVDVLASISRVMTRVADADHQASAAELTRLLEAYAQVADLHRVGAYRPGADADADAAIGLMPDIRRFLRQAVAEASPFDQTLSALHALCRRARSAGRPGAPRAAAGAGGVKG